MKHYVHAPNIAPHAGKMIVAVGVLTVIHNRRITTMSNPDFEIDQEWIDAWEGARNDEPESKPESLKYGELEEYRR